MKDSFLITTLIMAFLSIVSSIFAYQKGKCLEGLLVVKNLFFKMIPLLFFAFVLAGMIQVLVPKEIIIKWIGQESGIKGIFLGAILGGCLPGGPYVVLPLAAGLLKIGVSIPVLISFLAGWSLIGFTKIPLQIAILGPKVTLIRFLSVAFFAPLAGLIASLIMKIFRIK